jgi:hypothetical protein
MKETTILTGEDATETHDSVDAFFDAHGLTEWRAKELKLFTDAGFDTSDSSKQRAEMSEDNTSVIITVEYADQAEKDAIFANITESDEGHAGILVTLSEDHLF